MWQEIIRGWINLLRVNHAKPSNDVLVMAHLFSPGPRRNLVDIFTLSHDRWRLGYLRVKSLPLWWRKNFDPCRWTQLSNGWCSLRIMVYKRRVSDFLFFFYFKRKLCPINCRLEFRIQFSLNVVGILNKRGNGKTETGNVFGSGVEVYSRWALMLKAIKVNGRWRCFILNFIIYIDSGFSSLLLPKMDCLNSSQASLKLLNN